MLGGKLDSTASHRGASAAVEGEFLGSLLGKGESGPHLEHMAWVRITESCPAAGAPVPCLGLLIR